MSLIVVLVVNMMNMVLKKLWWNIATVICSTKCRSSMSVNKKNELKELFKKSLLNSKKDVTNQSTKYNLNNKIIYFYEWSDIFRKPLIFNDLESFEKFLTRCGIELKMCDRKALKRIGCSFVSCYKGTKNLAVYTTYNALRESLDKHNRSCCT